MKLRPKFIPRRPGRPRRFRAWGSIIFITIITTLASAVTLGVNHVQAKMAMADTLQAKVTTAETQKAQVVAVASQVSQQNDELKQRLADSSKVQVDPQTREIVLYYIHQYFGKEADQAIKVFTCESGLSPNTIHVNKPGLGVDRGVSQLNSIFQGKRFEKMFPGIPFDIGAQDIQMNLRTAKAIYDEQGNFGMWVCARLLNIN